MSVLRLSVYVQPRAARSEFAGLHDGVPKIRLAAPPVDGEANAELIRFLADALGTGRSNIRVRTGASGRRKVLEIAGVTADMLAAVLPR